MCYYEYLYFSGCGCVQRKTDSVREACPVAEVYSRDCQESQCGPHPQRAPVECFGLVCTQCLDGRGAADKGKSKSSSGKKRQKKSKQ